MSDFDETRATAQLPGVDIEIVHRRSPAGDAEQLSINLQATPSFDAFGRFLEGANPLLFWARFAQFAWMPWLSAFPASLPGGQSRALPAKPAAIAEPEQEDGGAASNP